MSLPSVLYVTAWLSFTARARMSASAVSGERRSSRTLTSSTERMYCAAVSNATSSGRPRFAGQPPLQHQRATSCIPVSQRAGSIPLPSRRARSDTRAADSPDSHSAIGLMVSLAILPVPEWRTFSRLSLASDVEPVRSSKPRSPPASSTLRRAASHTSGTSCHSSTRCGTSPTSASAGSI